MTFTKHLEKSLPCSKSYIPINAPRALISIQFQRKTNSFRVYCLERASSLRTWLSECDWWSVENESAPMAAFFMNVRRTWRRIGFRAKHTLELREVHFSMSRHEYRHTDTLRNASTHFLRFSLLRFSPLRWLLKHRNPSSWASSHQGLARRAIYPVVMCNGVLHTLMRSAVNHRE